LVLIFFFDFKNINNISVIAQVERLAATGTLNSRLIKIPGILVDCVVVAKPENHWQTFATHYNPGYNGELQVPLSLPPPLPLNERKIISRRAALELKLHSIINLGIGMPEGIAKIAFEERIIDYVTLTAEAGVIGGIPNGGLDFGTAVNKKCLFDQGTMFDFYDGGGLDCAFFRIRPS